MPKNIDKEQKLNVFISYQTSDKLIAGKLKEILSAWDIDSFLAHEDLEVSVEWQAEILNNIKSSSLFICLLSKHYLNSIFCMQESGMAIILDMPIMPLSIDETTPPGFISKFQSKQISPNNLSIDDILPGILKWNKDKGINIIIELIGSSGSFRGAEANFKRILPFLDNLKNNQAKLLFEKIIENDQIYSAGLCLSDYIPKMLQKYGRLLSENEYNEWKKIYEWNGRDIITGNRI
jgi:hypothetical protein